jgi:LmbE family N-acetylglucosaminyl deacetylase
VPTLLAFIPHPDDESYSFGGLLALAASAGWDCFVHCASSGEKGKRHDGGETHPNEVAEAREDELARSCEILGARPPEFWGLPDGQMRLHRGEHERIHRLVRALRPDLLLTLGADGAYGHPDHTALHRWVFEAWSALPERRPALLFPVFPKGLFLPQWEKCRHMLGDPPDPPADAVGSDAWHYEVAISGVRDRKLASIAAHRSQLPGGDPKALFPPGIVASLLDVERFEDASGRRGQATAQLLASLTGEQSRWPRRSG